MQKQPCLFKMEEVFNLKTIEENTKNYIKKKFPKPCEEESIDEYLEFIEAEYKLELASRLKDMAERLEIDVKSKGYY